MIVTSEVMSCIEDDGMIFVSYKGEEYALAEIAQKTGRELKSIKKRFKRYQDGEISIEQLFMTNLTTTVACPRTGIFLLPVNPAQMGATYWHYLEILKCGQEHYSHGLCKKCYYMLDDSTQQAKIDYEKTEAAQARRNRNNNRLETKAIKRLYSRKTRLANSHIPEDWDGSNEAKLMKALKNETRGRYPELIEDEIEEVATAAIAYWKKKNR